MTILDSIKLIAQSWNGVSKNTIKNCFQHAGLVKSIEEFHSDDDLPLNQRYEKYKSVDDDDWNVLLSDWLRSHCSDVTTVEKYLSELDRFTTIDDNLVATETSMDCDIIAEIEVKLFNE
ncbi:unnamed protein product [Acanthoscelides obtectus]|uniref:DDE-1 domain-containing protein n=1 Tax=Acanthoscelides obtectus TaxID=200917 RepID=A0A9P0MCI8_ACAOB|nr:unnamed protein product [Acanthoscelides obtectus]CAK1664516.1 hypothetical protein AOBTE_LOCUS24303 [Acanthoscelides obtectus]